MLGSLDIEEFELGYISQEIMALQALDQISQPLETTVS